MFKCPDEFGGLFYHRLEARGVPQYFIFHTTISRGLVEGVCVRAERLQQHSTSDVAHGVREDLAHCHLTCAAKQRQTWKAKKETALSAVTRGHTSKNSNKCTPEGQERRGGSKCV